ncbi:hypothetical protein KUTeg_019750 [Tegillarca granosa]|uniref:Uncharacterized protein n=1 Tax=Tegillarca granosa TaxID=220873 RepID=A0ABQ9EDI1_TEGGR|nr:hypothetical protein KUTeg_019750 [Tegillarca granosa]
MLMSSVDISVDIQYALLVLASSTISLMSSSVLSMLAFSTILLLFPVLYQCWLPVLYQCWFPVLYQLLVASVDISVDLQFHISVGFQYPFNL